MTCNSAYFGFATSDSRVLFNVKISRRCKNLNLNNLTLKTLLSTVTFMINVGLQMRSFDPGIYCDYSVFLMKISTMFCKTAITSQYNMYIFKHFKYY